MKKIFAIALTLVSLTSCTSEWLDVKPTTTTPADNAYTTEAKLDNALVAAYAPLQWLDFTYGEFHGCTSPTVISSTPSRLP